MATRKQSHKLFIEVLQNGYTICSRELPLQRNHKVTIGTHVKATLVLPYYPLSSDIDLLRVDKKGVHFDVRSGWEGFVTSNGDVVDIAGHKGQELTLRSGDYGSVYYGDLQVLLRLGKAWQPPDRKVKKRCPPALLSLAFYTAQEKKVMLTAALIALLAMGPLLYFSTLTTSTKPRSIVDLGDGYIESIMFPGHFDTLPEALQNNLDRRSYPRSAIRYYTGITEMLAGLPISYPSLMFDSSKTYFNKLHDERKDTLQQFEDHQREYEANYLAKPETALIDLPVVRGESVRQATLRILDKIDLQQNSFRDQLDKRRKMRAVWEEIPAFDGEDYRRSKSAARKENEARLSQISPFQMESNEANMYRIAKDWADRTAYRRKVIVLNSAPKAPLVADEYAEITVPETMNFASFLRKAAVLANEDKLASIQASQYGVTPKVKIKEPLIGEIDPKLVSKTVEENWHGLRLCYELALRRDKQLAGEMEWRWRIDSRGDISEIELVTTTIGDNRMLSCIKNKMNAWRFPPPRRGSVEVRYPFRFSKTKG